MRDTINQCNQKEIDDFNKFIEAIELIDILTLGNFFTWSNTERTARSILVRFLISKSVWLVGKW